MTVAIPQKPPLEIVKQGRVWLVQECLLGGGEGEIFSTHDTQMEAIRTAKSRMDSDLYPCTLRWESDDNVTNIYWNPLYERIELRYDELIDAFTLVPEAGTCAIEQYEDQEAAYEDAKVIQYEYDFKYLTAYDDGTEYGEREHWFLRYDITDSGVRLDRSQIEAHPAFGSESDGTEDDEDDADTDLRTEQAATPGTLGVSIPDVTKVEFVDTDGIVHRYGTPWGDGTTAQILVLSQKYASHEDAREAFMRYFSPWKRSVDHPAVASIYEDGTEPTPWVAYRSGEFSLRDVGHDMSPRERLDVLKDITTAVTAIEGPVCGIRPENIRLWTASGDWRVVVANWGITWSVPDAVEGIEHVTSFTAPEQLDGTVTDRTCVYQLGAVAYWLLCESRPLDNEPDTIRSGAVTSPDPISGISSATGPVLKRALALDPGARHDTPEELFRKLRDSA